MKKALMSLLSVCLFSAHAFAQDPVFGEQKKPARKGFVFSINGDYDLPGADMAKRFGASYRVGVEVFYKTKSNWMFGPKLDLIFGGKIKEDSLMINLKDNSNMVLNISGQRQGVGTFERGYMIGVQLGKLINTSKKSSDNGVMFLTSVGFIQHKINIFDRSASTPELKTEFKKGYDRLANGLYVEEYVCYNYFADNGLINFHIGLDVMAGFTAGRRDFLWDVRRPDTGSRLDLLFGIRGGWYLPIFKRKSEEFFFE
ncbi:MAG: hypothetical protein J0H46_10270 [Bacteroidetes bacterium]|nr:hypothetical protein [Bacteroidota bacterium]